MVNMKISFITCLVLLVVIYGCLGSSSDEETDLAKIHNNDKECDNIGDSILDKMNVYYPKGFICESWLQNKSYFSKTQCSCYRGKPVEIIRYSKTTGDVLYISSNIKYANETKKINCTNIIIQYHGADLLNNRTENYNWNETTCQ